MCIVYVCIQSIHPSTGEKNECFSRFCNWVKKTVHRWVAVRCMAGISLPLSPTLHLSLSFAVNNKSKHKMFHWIVFNIVQILYRHCYCHFLRAVVQSLKSNKKQELQMNFRKRI